MALTKEQIVKRLLPRALVKRNNNIVWGDVVSAVAQVDTLQKQAIVAALQAKEYKSVGKMLVEILMAYLEVEVKNDINTKLADNRLDINELGELL